MGQELVITERDIKPWGEMIEAFLNTLQTDSTRQTYASTVLQLPAELGGYGPAEATAQVVSEWARLVRDEVGDGKISPNTGKRRIMAVKSFFRFAYTVGQSGLSKDLRGYVLKPPKGTVLKPFQVLSEDERAKLLDAVQGQHRRMLAVLVYAGLRVTELCRLNRADYYTDEVGRFWLQVRGKGEKVRVVPVGDRLVSEIGVPQAHNDREPLFNSREGDGYYSRVRVYQIVQDAIKRASIKKRISPHSLRHTAAMVWIRAAVPLPVVQKWLGHASLDTTRRYLDHFENGEAHQYMP